MKSNGYHSDATKHEIVTEALMFGCPSLVTRYRVEGDLTHREAGAQSITDQPAATLPAGIPCTVTISDLIDGRMRVTGVRRYVDREPLK